MYLGANLKPFLGGLQVCWTAKATPEKSSTAPASWCGTGAKRARSGPSCSITSILSDEETLHIQTCCGFGGLISQSRV